ncbi:MAG: gamma-glutamyl-gamma-aminobutyrate hydrolase family protein [Chloroflexota bacterium]
MSRPPRIALTLSRPDSPVRVDSRDYYVVALTQAGAEIVELYPGDALPDDIDGLLIAGGGDIDPARYGEPNEGSHHIEESRDSLEFDAYQRATELGVPVLGICRGFQVLNVARGGRLLQDVTGHEGPPDGEHWVNAHEDVAPTAGSRLAEATGGAPLTVNSHHHQVVTNATLGDGLTPTMTVGDYVEAFEATDEGPWLVGVQWHPERAHEVSADATGIIKAFVEQAANR